MVNAPSSGSTRVNIDDVRNEFAWFKQDVVRCKYTERQALLGVIELVGGHHGDGEDDDEGQEPLEAGKARVRWFRFNHPAHTFASLRLRERCHTANETSSSPRDSFQPHGGRSTCSAEDTTYGVG